MSATVNYKNNTIATIADGDTKTLLTSGTWLEDDIEIVDTTSGGGSQFTATLENAGRTGMNYAYVTYDGTQYITAGSTFVYSAGDTLTCSADYMDGTSSIYVDDVLVNSGTPAQYIYTLPEADIAINFNMSSSGYIVRIYTDTGIQVDPLSVTANGTYTASRGHAYSPVTVNVPPSNSSWTKIAETTYQVNTTNTSAATVATLATGHNELWTNAKWVYVRIYDTAGKRSGYFYGSDQFMYVTNTANTSTSTAMRIYMKCSTSGSLSVTAMSGSSGYGVWADTLYSDGRIRIRSRYHSSNSLTVNGTFKVEVYLLDPAGGVSIFP